MMGVVTTIKSSLFGIGIKVRGSNPSIYFSLLIQRCSQPSTNTSQVYCPQNQLINSGKILYKGLKAIEKNQHHKRDGLGGKNTQRNHNKQNN